MFNAIVISFTFADLVPAFCVRLLGCVAKRVVTEVQRPCFVVARFTCRDLLVRSYAISDLLAAGLKGLVPQHHSDCGPTPLYCHPLNARTYTCSHII